MMRPTPRPRRERGAALVELALLTPFLLLLIFGTIEIGWLFAQQVDIRHGAREAARLISVNAEPAGAGTQGENIVDDVCDRMDLFPGTSIEIERDGTTVRDGARATVSLTAGLNTLTGLLDWAIPSSFVLSDTVETRVQIAATWSNTTGVCS